jgi:hypothetical protein
MLPQISRSQVLLGLANVERPAVWSSPKTELPPDVAVPVHGIQTSFGRNAPLGRRDPHARSPEVSAGRSDKLILTDVHGNRLDHS